MKWKVCPVQGRQLKDVRPEDICGDFRLCKTYRSGGGYDKFSQIANRTLEVSRFKGSLDNQFVVQLYGCHLRCPYCYVTRDGVFGKYVEYSTENLLLEFYDAYYQYGCGVLHLMGGAPALYLNDWPKILDKLSGKFVFHSDILLTEKPFTVDQFKAINRPNTLYAVNIKGVTTENYVENTGKEPDTNLFWKNFNSLVHSGVKFYLTFTNPDRKFLNGYLATLAYRYGEKVLENYFIIDLVKYAALEDGNAF